MAARSTSTGRSIKVGVITDQTGPLSFLGIANANVARMVIDDINSRGGLLGEQIALHLEDSATTDSVAEDAVLSVPIETRLDFSPGLPRVLFQGDFLTAHRGEANYDDVTPDGQRLSFCETARVAHTRA